MFQTGAGACPVHLGIEKMFSTFKKFCSTKVFKILTIVVRGKRVIFTISEVETGRPAVFIFSNSIQAFFKFGIICPAII